jgi:hypothetical protein
MAELTESTIALSNFASSSDLFAEALPPGLDDAEYNHIVK